MADPVKEFEAYRRELLDLLDDQDPLEVLARTPGRLAERVGDLADDAAGRRPRPDAWSVKEVLGHLCDTEWVYGYRIRVILSHDRPPIPGYDQDLAVKGLAHNQRSLPELLSELRALRGLNLALYRRSQGAAWDRVGLHAERGEESVELNVRLLAGHDLRHERQIERTLAEMSGS